MSGAVETEESASLKKPSKFKGFMRKAI